MSNWATTEISGGPREVFEFTLFFFRIPPDPRLFGEGRERNVPYRNGGEVLTEWKYGERLVYDVMVAPGVSRRIVATFRPSGDRATSVRWTFGLAPRGILAWLLTAPARLGMTFSKQFKSDVLTQLLRFRSEYERRNPGTSEAFGEYHAEFQSVKKS